MELGVPDSHLLLNEENEGSLHPFRNYQPSGGYHRHLSTGVAHHSLIIAHGLLLLSRLATHVPLADEPSAPGNIYPKLYGEEGNPPACQSIHPRTAMGIASLLYLYPRPHLAKMPDDSHCYRRHMAHPLISVGIKRDFLA